MPENGEFITDHATGQKIPLIRIQPASQNKSKIQPLKATTEKPGVHEKDALKLIGEYEAINKILNEIEQRGQIGRISAFFLKRRLHAIAVREYNLWRLMTASKKARRSTEIVSFSSQKNIEKISWKISEKVTSMRNSGLFPKGFTKGIYRFKVSKLKKRSLFRRRK